MSVLDWDGLVFYDKKIKKHIEKKLIEAGLSKDEIDNILNDYLTITDAVATYCKKTDFDALKTEVDKVKTTLGNENLNTTSQTLTGGVNELKTDLTTHTDNANIHVTSAEKSKWNAKLDNTDLTNYAKKVDVNSGLDGKVDKVSGKSLVDDTEIARLKLVDNYDDTDIKRSINAKANTTDLTTHTSDTSIHITSSERTKWNNKAEMTDIPNLTNYATKTYVTDEIAKASTGGTVDLTGYAKTTDVDTKLTNYVKKTDAFSGNYNDLTNKPNIPSLDGYAKKTDINMTLEEANNKLNEVLGTSDIKYFE